MLYVGASSGLHCRTARPWPWSDAQIARFDCRRQEKASQSCTEGQNRPHRWRAPQGGLA
jgi:hypothetical protein